VGSIRGALWRKSQPERSVRFIPARYRGSPGEVLYALVDEWESHTYPTSLAAWERLQRLVAAQIMRERTLAARGADARHDPPERFRTRAHLAERGPDGRPIRDAE
jgi:hypothetical protein